MQDEQKGGAPTEKELLVAVHEFALNVLELVILSNGSMKAEDRRQALEMVTYVLKSMVALEKIDWLKETRSQRNQSLGLPD